MSDYKELMEDVSDLAAVAERRDEVSYRKSRHVAQPSASRT